jgi:putative DNA-binding protein
MLSLGKSQLGFAEALLGRPASDFVDHIVPGGLDPEDRLLVYRNNMFGSLTRALQGVYPVTQRLVGEGFFKYACTQYIGQHPPSSGDVDWYGQEFAEFMRTFPPAAGLVYLPDIARLEWACHRVFFEADHGPLPLERLADVPAADYGDLKFRLHPATRLIHSDYPIHRIWEVNQAGYEGSQTVDLDMGGIDLLVKRPGHSAELEPLSCGQWAFLSAIAAGRTLGEASEATLEREADFDFAVSLRRFIAERVLVDFMLE